MKHILQKEVKPTLKSVLNDQKNITGKDLVRRYKEKEKRQAMLQEAIEFEHRS